MCFTQGSLSGDQTNYVLQQYINIIAIHWHKSCYVINNTINSRHKIATECQ